MSWIIYIGCVIYAFMKWGLIWGIVNIFIPFSLVYDIVAYFINHS